MKNKAKPFPHSQQNPQHENVKMQFMLHAIYLIRRESRNFPELARFWSNRWQEPVKG